ncbi:MAG: hypothetical protein V3U52_03005 [Thermoplasmata archaeon]
MKARRVLGLVSFLLAITGGILVLRSGLNFALNFEAILRALVPLTLGLSSVVGAFYVYTRRYWGAGLICVATGLLEILLERPFPEGALILSAGVLALAAARG